LLSVKLAGGADVTVVWASALPMGNADVESSAAKRQATDRCEDITILVKARTLMSGRESTACYTARI
jgi:hypothetical protein